MIGVALGTLGAGNCTVSSATMVSIKEISERGFELPYDMARIPLKLNTTRKSSCVNARGIPPARGRKMLTPPGWTDPPPSWTWPPRLDWPLTWPTHPPLARLTFDLTPPHPAGPDTPRLDWPLTWPPQLDLTPPMAGLTFDLTPPAGPDPPPPPRLDWPLTWPPHWLDLTPPRCELTKKVKLLPSRRTTYAGGNNRLCFTFNWNGTQVSFHERKRKTIGCYPLGMLASINTDNLTPNYRVPP